MCLCKRGSSTATEGAFQASSSVTCICNDAAVCLCLCQLSLLKLESKSVSVPDLCNCFLKSSVHNYASLNSQTGTPEPNMCILDYKDEFDSTMSCQLPYCDCDTTVRSLLGQRVHI